MLLDSKQNALLDNIIVQLKDVGITIHRLSMCGDIFTFSFYSIDDLINKIKHLSLDEPCTVSATFTDITIITATFDYCKICFCIEFDLDKLLATILVKKHEAIKVTIDILKNMLIQHKPFKIVVTPLLSKVVQKLAYKNDVGGWGITDGIVQSVSFCDLEYLYYHTNGYFTVAKYKRSFDEHAYPEVELVQDWRINIPKCGIMCWSSDSATPLLIIKYDNTKAFPYMCRDGTSREHVIRMTKSELVSWVGYADE